VAHVREACGIPGTSVRTAFLCRDKPAMKDALRDAGVSTAQSIGSGSADEIRALEQSLTGFLTDDGIPFEVMERNDLRFVEVEDPYEGNWFFVALEGQLVGTYAPLEDGMVEAITNFAGNTLSDSAGAQSDLRQATTNR